VGAPTPTHNTHVYLRAPEAVVVEELGGAAGAGVVDFVDPEGDMEPPEPPEEDGGGGDGGDGELPAPRATVDRPSTSMIRMMCLCRPIITVASLSALGASRS
jgi:hypothetical protein